MFSLKKSVSLYCCCFKLLLLRVVSFLSWFIFLYCYFVLLFSCFDKAMSLRISLSLYSCFVQYIVVLKIIISFNFLLCYIIVSLIIVFHYYRFVSFIIVLLNYLFDVLLHSVLFHCCFLGYTVFDSNYYFVVMLLC